MRPKITFLYKLHSPCLEKKKSEYNLGMRGYTGTVKLPVSIIFQTVRYHNFHISVFHMLLFRSSPVLRASQIAAHPVNVTPEQVNNTMDQTD